MKSLPNYLTILRILLIPAIIGVFIYMPTNQGALIAFGIFIVAAITDFFDGYFARKFKVESKFGAMMDPIADKLMVGAVLLYLLQVGRADLVPVLIIMMRELLVSGYREFIAANAGEMPVTKLAKWKTTFQFIAIITLLFVPLVKVGEMEQVRMVGQLLLWFAALLTFMTGWQYTAHTMKFIKDSK